ncbi:MAG: hypothetical protein OXD01_00850 [Gammaproteobacteria bacterium]|nr:hypothetical protein [Gammaproteobacteria bacterium]
MNATLDRVFSQLGTPCYGDQWADNEMLSDKEQVVEWLSGVQHSHIH